MYISDSVIDETVHLFDSIDTENNNHAEYLLNWVKLQLKAVKNMIAEIEAL